MTTTFPLQPRMEFYNEHGQRMVLTSPILHRFLSDLFSQVGGETNINVEDLQKKTVVDSQNKDIRGLLEPEYVASVSANYTTIGNDVIRVTAACTITLNPTPDDNEQVIVYQNAGYGAQVQVTDGTGTDILVADQIVVSYRYLIDIDQWVRGA